MYKRSAGDPAETIRRGRGLASALKGSTTAGDLGLRRGWHPVSMRARATAARAMSISCLANPWVGMWLWVTPVSRWWQQVSARRGSI